MIKNKKTGQIYIGQSKNIEQRFKKHCCANIVDVAIANEGVENFDFIILEELHQDELDKREAYWIDYFNAYNDEKHYNQSSGCSLKDRAVYSLWDVSSCHYHKRCGARNKPFDAIYNNYRLPIGMFHDFVTCEIIIDLAKKSI